MNPGANDLIGQGRADVDITVVITCYNETAFITDSIENVVKALEITGHSYEIIVVDDVSQDDSVQKIEAYIQPHPQHPVRLVRNQVNRGRPNNFVEAAFLGRGRYYRQCCGDNSEPLESLVTIFKCIGRADIIVPCQNQDEVVGKTRTRRWLSKFFTFLVNRISGYNLSYYNGMAIHLRSNVLRWHPSSYGFGFESDIITRLLDEGASYLQVPAVSIDRKGTVAGVVTVRHVLSVGHTLLELAIRRARKLLYGRNFPKPVAVPLPPDIELRARPAPEER